uniref:Uncharacterized protein LOC105352219 n=1 Tax=Rhizophora mucronata TaxID=61149 RepID=A0A2P2MXS8_RHIMU
MERRGVSDSFSCHSSRGQDIKDCCYKAAECGCSGCLLCVFCPLCIVSCCIKLPCKIGLKAAKHAAQWVSCGSEKKVYASYSSFSDIESDDPSAKVSKWDNSSGSSRYLMRHRTNGSKRSAAG